MSSAMPTAQPSGAGPLITVDAVNKHFGPTMC